MSKKILLVEDEALIAMNEAQMLKKHGDEVVTAYTGEKAIEAVDTDSDISLILMDIDLGKGIDGTEAAKEILSRHELPIVFRTSHSEKEYVDKVKKITRYGYVLKNSGEFVLIESITMAYELFEEKQRVQDHQKKIENINAELSKANETLQIKNKALSEAENLLSNKINLIFDPTVSIESAAIKDVLNIEVIQDILNRFNELTGMATALIDLEGNVLVAAGWKEICTNFHRVHPDTAKSCKESDLYLSGNLRRGEFVDYKCKNGLRDVVTPLFIGDKHLANIFTGQVFYTSDEIDENFFINQANKYGFNQDAYMNALKKVPVYDKEKVYSFINFLIGFFELVANQSYTNIALAKETVEHKNSQEKLKKSMDQLSITLNSIGDAVISTDIDGNIVRMNPVAEELTGWTIKEAKGKNLNELLHLINADTREIVDNPVGKVIQTGEIVGLANHTVLISKDGRELQIADSAAPIKDDEGNINGVVLVFRDVTEEYETDRQLQERVKELRSIEWMLSNKTTRQGEYIPEYGDLSKLNRDGLILHSVGKKQLKDIASEYLELLEASTAIYEKNGDYALGIFSSGWCQLMDAASRRLCKTEDNQEALNSGKWLCHESCWKVSSLSMDEGQPVGIVCNGGINMYAVPVWANDEIVGSINFGYGNPPTDETELKRLSDKYELPIEQLREKASTYKSRPQFIIDYAKRRIKTAAKTLGFLIERREAEESIKGEQFFLNSILDNIKEALIICNEKGEIIRFNESARRLHGFPEKPIPPEQWAEYYDLYYPDGLTPLNKEDLPLYRALNGEDVVNIEIMVAPKDGESHILSCNGRQLIDNEGEKVGAVIAMHDITERKQAEIDLQESQERFRILHNASFGGITIHEKGVIIDCNQGLSDITGYSYDELVGMDGLLLIAPDWRDFVMEKITSRYEEPYEAEGIRKDNSIYPVRLHGKQISYKGKQVRVVEFRDITEQKRIEEQQILLNTTSNEMLEISERQELYDYIATQLHSMYPEAYVIYLSVNETKPKVRIETIKGLEDGLLSRIATVCGYNLLGKEYEIDERMKTVFYSGKLTYLKEGMIELSSNVLPSITARQVQKIAGIKETYAIGVMKNKQLVGAIHIFCRKPSELKNDKFFVERIVYQASIILHKNQLENHSRRSLKEKDFLMKELNHRVKNNLNMVSSLINLKDSEIENDLSDLKHRVDVIKLVHEKLHQHNDIEHIEVKEYFQELLESIFYSTSRLPVQIINTVEDVRIPTKAAISLGLVLNEIATNAEKYGFTDNEEARFSVDMRKDSDSKHYILTFSNTGNPFPEEIGLENPETMGLQLVSTLVAQLSGTIELQKTPNPVFTIRFPIEEE